MIFWFASDLVVRIKVTTTMCLFGWSIFNHVLIIFRVMDNVEAKNAEAERKGLL